MDYLDESQPRYYATIYYKGVKYDLGTFWTKEEAQKARSIKANELFGEYVNSCEKIYTIEDE